MNTDGAESIGPDEKNPGSRPDPQHRSVPRSLLAASILALTALAAIYLRSARELYYNWTLTDSYYTHGFLVPFISLYFVWKDRAALARLAIQPSLWGFVWLAGATVLLLLGDFLGFRVLAHLSILPMVAGVVVTLLGTAWARRLWFPIAFLLFMVPIPPSLTQSIALRLKLLAAHYAVALANLFTLPLVQEGSWIHFGEDRLLVGDVCGGLRSLIALLALGTLYAYISNVRNWGRVLILLMAAPIAITANIIRIFVLCVAGYFWGSQVAGGKVHDYSGILIFAVAILLFSALDKPLRRFAPRPNGEVKAPPSSAGFAPITGGPRPGIYAAGVACLALVAAGHLAIVHAQDEGHLDAPPQTGLSIPSKILDYTQDGSDYEVDARTRELLETSAILIRNYRSPRGRPIQLTIVHAGGTRRSLHFPEVCLVGDGWELVKQEDVSVGILFTARKLVLMKGTHYEAVLYWFKTGEAITGNYFLNALYWARNQVTFGTPTSAMIKLTTPIVSDGEEAAFAALEDFAMKFTPVMMSHID